MTAISVFEVIAAVQSFIANGLSEQRIERTARACSPVRRCSGGQPANEAVSDAEL